MLRRPDPYGLRVRRAVWRRANTAYSKSEAVLEAGCGVGAQTVALARNSPVARIVAINASAASIEQARAQVTAAGLANVCFQQSNILALPFDVASFDHVFACFALEHLPQPRAALAALERVLKLGGTITVIEGDNGSILF